MISQTQWTFSIVPTRLHLEVSAVFRQELTPREKLIITCVLKAISYGNLFEAEGRRVLDCSGGSKQEIRVAEMECGL